MDDDDADELPALAGGEKGRYYCGDCSTEYEVTLEPKAKPGKNEVEPQVPRHCPFCGGGTVEAN
jgi:ribosomal protein S27AE